MENWIRNPLTEIEVIHAMKQVDDMQPLKDIQIQQLFPSLKTFEPQINKIRKIKNQWKEKKK